ncbi:hypothetical protein FB45DRAFT_945830 [Roridomyces roridus]|uniref:Uncharacterized protein n=1 Tax=Roridomyces roridus TaxID=1738132 RepID=A0AAD7F8H9_9AGAR|nr:hypothetical protein FB45DRAFT_945830 [Roridomyces roridus]
MSTADMRISAGRIAPRCESFKSGVGRPGDARAAPPLFFPTSSRSFLRWLRSRVHFLYMPPICTSCSCFRALFLSRCLLALSQLVSSRASVLPEPHGCNVGQDLSRTCGLMPPPPRRDLATNGVSQSVFITALVAGILFGALVLFGALGCVFVKWKRSRRKAANIASAGQQRLRKAPPRTYTWKPTSSADSGGGGGLQINLKNPAAADSAGWMSTAHLRPPPPSLLPRGSWEGYVYLASSGGDHGYDYEADPEVEGATLQDFSTISTRGWYVSNQVKRARRKERELEELELDSDEERIASPSHASTPEMISIQTISLLSLPTLGLEDADAATDAEGSDESSGRGDGDGDSGSATTVGHHDVGGASSDSHSFTTIVPPKAIISTRDRCRRSGSEVIREQNSRKRFLQVHNPERSRPPRGRRRD